MSASRAKKRTKKREKPSINRVIAQHMIEIQDYVRELDAEIKKVNFIGNKILAKLIVMETRECLNETLKLIESK